ncbi:MAG TPA: TRAP transporter small permease [Thermodesulfobacteriota bacterium]|nr:TRAP transporter small permease [Thermodesulfobacteriota bacterium]
MLRIVAILFSKIDDELDRVNRYALIVLVGIMTLTVLLGVVSRGINVSVTWTQEVSEFAFVWLSLLGTAAVFKRKGHIVVDAANDLMPKKMVGGIQFFGEITMIAFFVLLIYSGTEIGLINYATKSPVLGLSVGLHYLSVPVASLLMMLNQLNRFFSKLAQR